MQTLGGPPPCNSGYKDNKDYIRILLYSYYTTITGWGVFLMQTPKMIHARAAKLRVPKWAFGHVVCLETGPFSEILKICWGYVGIPRRLPFFLGDCRAHFEKIQSLTRQLSKYTAFIAYQALNKAPGLSRRWMRLDMGGFPKLGSPFWRFP